MIEDSKPGDRRVEIDSRWDQATEMHDRISELLEDHNYSRRERFDIQLAVDEAIVNAIKHGNVQNPRKKVAITYNVDESRVSIRVEDEGNGFSVDAVPDPTLPENVVRPSGRGIWLMRRYMDLVEYNDRGNAVTLHKFRINSTLSAADQ